KTVAGTPRYMSPEQAMGLPLDARSDIYSLAVVLHEALSGAEWPVTDGSVQETLTHVVETPLPPIARPNSAVPDRVGWILERALSKNREERYVSADEFAQALREAVPGLTVPTTTGQILGGLAATTAPYGSATIAAAGRSAGAAPTMAAESSAAAAPRAGRAAYASLPIAILVLLELLILGAYPLVPSASRPPIWTVVAVMAAVAAFAFQLHRMKGANQPSDGLLLHVAQSPDGPRQEYARRLLPPELVETGIVQAYFPSTDRRVNEFA